MLRLQNVKKSFREPDGDILPIFDIERFDVAAGEQMVLVGRSGCGKTTLLHIISRASREPTRASSRSTDSISAGCPKTARDRFRADKLGYIFQTFNLLPGFSALENVLLGMTFATGRPDAVRGRHLLERVGLAHRMTHKPAMLSVGEQQRVAVARALANRPKLLLADEPTANVDTRHQQQVIDLIRETCREENVALVLVTHTPEVARQFDRVDNLEEFNRAIANGAAKSPMVSPQQATSLNSHIRPCRSWRIAWRSIQQRSLASSLTGLSVALGVMLVVAVLVIGVVVKQSFQSGNRPGLQHDRRR